MLLDGSFENQAVLQNNPYTLQSNGARWGSAWGGPDWGWSSWQYNFAGAWVGGAIARTEDFAAGWKWARSGDVFGIIKDRQSMTQTFTATEDAFGTLSWFDANRASWREHDWFGRPNDYSVTITDSLGNVQTIGSYTSVVAGGNSYSNPVADQWHTVFGKSTWFAKTGATFVLLAGMTALFMVVGFALGGQQGMLLAFVFAAGMNLFSYWNSDKMVLRMHGAREIGPNEARSSRKRRLSSSSERSLV